MRVLFGFLQAILGLALVALAWTAAAAIVQDASRLPSVGTALSRALELVTGDDYRQHLEASASILLKGMLPAIAGGILLGIIAAITPVLRWLLGSIVMTTAAAPLIALMPMLLLWFGLGATLTTIAVAVLTLFPVANAVMMSRGSRQSSIALAIVRGIRLGIVFGATALVICEMLTARAGVGTFIMNAGAQFDATSAAAGIVLVFVPVIVVVALLQGIEEQLAA